MEPSNEAQANDAAITLLCRYVVQDANGYFHGSTQEISLVMATGHCRGTDIMKLKVS